MCLPRPPTESLRDLAGPHLDQLEGTTMKSLTEYLSFTLPERMAFVNITPRLEELVARSGITEGLLLCNAMHVTAS